MPKSFFLGTNMNNSARYILDIEARPQISVFIDDMGEIVIRQVNPISTDCCAEVSFSASEARLIATAIRKYLTEIDNRHDGFCT